MFQYIAAIQQDVVDFGFLPARGCPSVVLIAIEEGRASWADLESVQSIRINYSSKARAQTGHNAAGNGNAAVHLHSVVIANVVVQLMDLC